MSEDAYDGFLKAREAALLAELASVRATIAERARVTGRSPEQPTENASLEIAKRKSSKRDEKKYSGLYVSDAIYEVLAASASPLSAGQIWKALQMEGVEPIAEDSIRAITWALRKRARIHNDVVRVAYGKWDLRSRYTEATLRKFAKSNDGRGTASTEVHSARTKAGIEKRRAAGLSVGAKRRLTAEKVAEAEQLLASGHSIAAIARKVGVSPGTIYNSVGRNKVAELRAKSRAMNQQPISPSGEDASHLRVVK